MRGIYMMHTYVTQRHCGTEAQRATRNVKKLTVSLNNIARSHSIFKRARNNFKRYHNNIRDHPVILPRPMWVSYARMLRTPNYYVELLPDITKLFRYLKKIHEIIRSTRSLEIITGSRKLTRDLLFFE